MNSVKLVGRVVQTPELKQLPSGNAVCNFSVATSKKYTDKQGQKQERTEFSRVVVWGKSAENCGLYLQKGNLVAISGELETRNYEKDGIKHYVTEVKADMYGGVEFLTPKGEQQEVNQETAKNNDTGYAESDIPF